MNNITLTNWKLKYNNNEIPASVPGDITVDMWKANKVSNPYIAENFKDSEWVGRTNFTYVNEFEIDEQTLINNDVISLVFKGIDLFSTIYVNGQKVGSTKNAFLKYEFNVKEYLKIGKNILSVEMESTLNIMDKIDTTGYESIFNKPRIFVRKPQCHFGWDWAPKICAYGIIDEVYFECKNKYEILDVNPVSDIKGNVVFHIDVNYNTKPFIGPDGSILRKGEEPKNDIIKIFVSTKPFGDEYKEYQINLMGEKNFAGCKIENPELWWPIGYGKQPLYNYKVELYRDNKLMSSKEGRFAFREVKLIEEPKDVELIGMAFLINGKEIYLKGSNWVPPECFTGTMQDEKYKKLINLAKDMNVNIIRVWGGGAYEKDIFYNICDELGIMVWQDICLACADIPEDVPEFVNNLYEEVEYQVKRLRNHPSLIYWCGGNEKTGTYGYTITHGDFLVNNILYGMINNLDGARPYRRQSPHSFTDVGNESTSGDSHYGNFESALEKGLVDYRKAVNQKVVPFASECAVLGPSSEETLRKIFPEDHIWPMDSMWKERFMENPYAAILMDFPHRELFYAENLFGKVDSFENFVPKAMCAQAEALRVEAEYSRAHRGITCAWLNWMFNDIWPSGTWATVDYYLEPKQAYYYLKQDFASVLVSFFLDKTNKIHLFADNQSFDSFKTNVNYGVRTYEGDTIFEDNVIVEASLEKGFDKVLDLQDIPNDAYLFTKYNLNGKEITRIWSLKLFSGYNFKNEFEYEVLPVNNNEIKVKITAKTFVKSIFIHFKDNYKYKFEDNYLDLEKGQSKTITITCEEGIDLNTLSFNTLRI